MKITIEGVCFSPTDLVRFIESPFASWMDRFALEYPEAAPSRDQESSLDHSIRQRGFIHEDRVEQDFRDKGLNVVKIEAEGVNQKFQSTLDAMNDGTDVIAQAYLEKGSFTGYADFLVKMPGSSQLGDYHYEVWDSKLSKHLKPAYAIQLCCYAEMLESIQGVRPSHITVVLGTGGKERLRTSDFYHYYLDQKDAFLNQQANFDASNPPDPVKSKNFAHWSDLAAQLFIEQDHLFQIANITRNQIRKLNRANLSTMTELVETQLKTVPGINRTVFQRLKQQATIQKASAGRSKPLYKVYTPSDGEKNGLALLPPNSPLDIFFDIEGFPLEEDGLEYLWGATYFDDSGERCFRDFWAHNREKEQQAFQDFIQWAYGRWKQDPSMHIYHYANYEVRVCRRLMGRFGACEYEVDQLLRNGVFVDLFKVVREGVLLGEPRYSIKNVERLYRGKRETDVGNGGDSVAVYQSWLDRYLAGEEGDSWEISPILKGIRDYNLDDCNSTQELVDWLRERQKENGISYMGKTEIEDPEIKEEVSRRLKLRDLLLARASEMRDTNPTEAKLSENLAWVLEFHRRESKPLFWRLYDRLSLTHEELKDDPDCLGLCQRTDRDAFKPTPRARNLAYEYSFDQDQEFKGTKGSFYLLGEKDEDGKPFKVTYLPKESDLDNSLVVVQTAREPESTITLIPCEYIEPNPIPLAIEQVALSFYEGRLTRCAIIDFLMRSKPVIKNHSEGPVAPSNDPDKKLEQIIDAVEKLDHSYLTIQGPPGSGKSYTGQHLIAELVKQGYKIGISSNSHKAINNLLLRTAQHCHEKKIDASFACTKETSEDLTEAGINILKGNNQLIDKVRPSCVLGTTAWGFARDEMVDTLDYLFIDEAGQVSIANLIAMSRSAKNLVLLGDQMQLAQPIQGTHPCDSGLSILDYLLRESPTIPDDMGVFLGITYRMHSSVNEFVSEHIYEGKLVSHSDNDQQRIILPEEHHGKLNKEAGIQFIPVYHEGNTQASDEEVSEIQQLAHELIGRTYIDKNGNQRAIDWNDMLFVTPYNHQARKLKQALDSRAKVGSVDKFQGQEAPVVFLSMCASDASESTRGLKFLLDRHRLNVAISRAQALVIVVGNPGLGNVMVSHIEHARLVNLFSALCKNI